jgi:predicted metal-dependent phosphoesterase TrpH
MHVHSKYSHDGVLEPETIIKTAKRRGLKGVAITDHDTIMGALSAKKHETSDFEVIIGSEIKTDRGEIIGLFLEKDIVSRKAYEVIKEIKDQGGIVVVPHPFDRFRKTRFTPKDEDVRLIDCIEVFNSRCLFQKYNEEAMRFAAQHALKTIAGSDAHFEYEIGKAGIELDSKDDDGDLKKAILDGRVTIFGDKSPIVDHVFSRILQLFRK